jgi:LPPG:FO 2-phospho-L-lactate transferase
MPQEDIHVVVNTAEDIRVCGHLITPDIDTVLYLFAGKLNRDRWWGIAGDTYHTHQAMLDAGYDEGMLVGDLDRATHIMRSEMIGKGLSLTEATRKLCEAFGISGGVYPMTDNPVATHIHTPEGKLHFQDFWVGRRGEPDVLDVEVEGLRDASISPAVRELLGQEKNVLIGPSNPITSIGPIIGLSGMAEILREKNVIAVSPVIGNNPVSGPAGKFMRAKGYEVSPAGVAQYYADFLDVMVIDSQDIPPVPDMANSGCRFIKSNILMNCVSASTSLAQTILCLFEKSPV